MSLEFEKYAAKGNELVNMLADDLDVPRDISARIIRSTLHALRSRLPMNESFQVMSQLPMVFKSVYVDGWNPNENFERLHHVHDFLDEIRKNDGLSAAYDFGNDENAKRAVRGVFRTLSYFISKGEMEDILSVLSGEIKFFLTHAIGESRTVL